MAGSHLLDVSSSCPLGDRRPPLPASLLMHIAGYGLEHHYGDTRTPCHRLLEPSTTGSAAVDLSDDESLCVFISFSLLHPG